MKITVLGAVLVVAAVIVAILLLHYLASRHNPANPPKE
jgi:hypothetical protein